MESVLDAMEGVGCQNGEVENVNETMNDLVRRKKSFFERGSANGICEEQAIEISWWLESESVNDLGIGKGSEKRNACEHEEVVSGNGRSGDDGPQL